MLSKLGAALSVVEEAGGVVVVVVPSGDIVVAVPSGVTVVEVPAGVVVVDVPSGATDVTGAAPAGAVASTGAAAAGAIASAGAVVVVAVVAAGAGTADVASGAATGAIALAGCSVDVVVVSVVVVSVFSLFLPQAESPRAKPVTAVARRSVLKVIFTFVFMALPSFSKAVSVKFPGPRRQWRLAQAIWFTLKSAAGKGKKQKIAQNQLRITLLTEMI